MCWYEKIMGTASVEEQKAILLVEDDEDQVVLAMRALREHGIVNEVDEVMITGDGGRGARLPLRRGWVRRARHESDAGVRFARCGPAGHERPRKIGRASCR